MSTPAPSPNGQPPTYPGPGPAAAFPPPVEAGNGEIPSTFQPQPPVPLPAYEQPAAVPQLADQANAAPQVPEGGYASRIVRISLPQFHLQGLPEPWVEMRNPGMMSQDALEAIGRGLQGQQSDADAEPDPDVIMGTLAQLVRRWCMWDGTSEDDMPPMLPEQVDVASLRRAPVGVLKHVMQTVKELSDPQ